ncbi:Chemotaxis protein CheY [Clostridium sp. N3C]|uniref:response regulator n=1 Tax=Clostridium sp. N3C TaxID=1776758 RepID=UPI00092DF207|nr:response regulator [Clostridium sp. N3C]SCN22681.1 Chemotaxis protein CheY [Clostridium sp. N3C]
MLKILIVDDEYLVRDSLKMIISKNIKNVDFIDVASNGREAIEKAISFKPDIIFMDIHMPGIDGMEAIRQIRSINKDTLFVILTAYEFFDYAKEALSLGVSEYLLKPISKNKVIETVEQLRKIVDEKRDTLMREIQLKERMNSMVPMLETQFITNKIFNIDTPYKIEFYENVFGMNLREGYVMILLYKDKKGTKKERNTKLTIEKQRFYDIFSMKLKSLCSSLIGSPMQDRIVAFIPTTNWEKGFSLKQKAKVIAEKFNEKIEHLTELNYTIGIGGNYDIDNFERSFYEAYIAASEQREQAVISFDTLPYNDNKIDNFSTHKNMIFSNYILTGNIAEAKEVFEEIYLWLISVYGDDIYRIKSKVLDLLFIIDKNLPYNIEEIYELKDSHVLTILKTNNKEELRIEFLKYLSDIALHIRNQKASNTDGIIPMVLEYVNKNYNKEISLKDVANSVNLSYNYLSKIFKDEIGKSFIDYLTELRMEKSMKLLSNGNLSIKEICQQIGYNDPNYYCKAFKKLTGKTPSEYRALVSKAGENYDK